MRGERHKPLSVLCGNCSSLAADDVVAASPCLLLPCFLLLILLLPPPEPPAPLPLDRALIKQTSSRTVTMLTLTAIPATIPVVRDSMMDSDAAEATNGGGERDSACERVSVYE